MIDYCLFFLFFFIAELVHCLFTMLVHKIFGSAVFGGDALGGGGRWGDILLIMIDNINLEQVKTNPNLDLRKQFEDDVYNSITHSCKYFEPEELNEKLLNTSNNSLSNYSHNIRSLPGHWNDLH